jgi:predicted O-methyltransferase YrrM
LFNRFQLAKRYIHYYLTASNGKGHGIHSPFVFDLVKNVLRDKKIYSHYAVIEKAREQLLQEKSTIEVEDLGAGSSVIKANKRVVADIARSSLKPAKYAQLLYRIVQYYRPANIVELGTSLGVTTCYLAAGNKDATVHSIEGSAAIAEIAVRTFERTGLQNIQLTRGDFKKMLPGVLSNMQEVDLAFIDGNHRLEPTLEYCRLLLNHSRESTIFIFDDIHWSAGMETAWDTIKQHPQVTLSIDLFFIGLVFINPDFKIPQHYTIRF